MTTSTEPDPDKRITNSDEQEVAVNHSTREEGGYDEPGSAREPETTSSSKKEETGGVSNPEERDPEGNKNDRSRRKNN
jgi:hypothetical protein